MYWGALSTGISEPGRKRPGFFIRAGSEGGISFADPFEGGISFADPVEGGLQKPKPAVASHRRFFVFGAHRSKLRSLRKRKTRSFRCGFRLSGGEGGIRTRGTLARTSV